MNIDDLLQSLPSREDITSALSRYNSAASNSNWSPTNWTGSSSNSNDLLPALGIFGTGMLLGAGLAILFAPKAGSEIRQDIADKVNEFGGQAREMAEEAGERGRQMASEVGEQARQMAGQATQATQHTAGTPGTGTGRTHG